MTQDQTRSRQLIVDEVCTRSGEHMIARKGVVVSGVKTLTAEDFEAVWRMIGEQFRRVNARSTHRQDMTWEEYAEDVQDPSVLKVVAHDKRGNVGGYLSVHVGLDRIVWADRDKLQPVQEERDAEAASYYISTFVAPMTLSGWRIGSMLLEGALSYMAQVNELTGYESVAFFDTADVLHPAIPRYVQRVCRGLSDERVTFTLRPVYKFTDETGETQHYYAVIIAARDAA